VQRFARPCPVITFYSNLLPAAEDIPVPTVMDIIIQHYYATLDLAIAILATLKNLID